MNKLKRKEFLRNVYFDWEGYISIEEIERDIEIAKKKGATHIEFDPYVDSFESAELNITAYTEREETDEEYLERVNRETERKKENKRLRKIQYEKLKKEFEEEP